MLVSSIAFHRVAIGSNRKYWRICLRCALMWFSLITVLTTERQSVALLVDWAHFSTLMSCAQHNIARYRWCSRISLGIYFSCEREKFPFSSHSVSKRTVSDVMAKSSVGWKFSSSETINRHGSFVEFLSTAHFLSISNSQVNSEYRVLAGDKWESARKIHLYNLIIIDLIQLIKTHNIDLVTRKICT